MCEQLFILPGNAGTELIGKNIDVSVSDFEEIKNVVLNNNISMVVVGPEKPLVDGIYDFFITDSKLKDVTVIGPSRAGAMLEGSKDFSKEFMLKNSIPTAKYSTFSKENISDAYEFLETLSPPYVLKADGLAAG